MYRKCVTEISVQHQKQITDALLQLLQKMPLEDITVTRLCETAGVSRRVFYHLFTGKTGVLHALVDQRLLAMAEPVPGIPDPVLAFFLYWKGQKPFLDALCANGLVCLLQERMIAGILQEEYDLIHDLHRWGWNQEKEVLVFNVSGVIGLVYNWYREGYGKRPEEMAEILRGLLTRPFVTPKKTD